MPCREKCLLINRAKDVLRYNVEADVKVDKRRFAPGKVSATAENESAHFYPPPGDTRF